MFEIIETNGINSGFSLDIPESILPVFDQLKIYCDLHGYPKELNISLSGQGGFKYIRPTKEGLNGIAYRFAVNRILDKLSVSEATANLLQERCDDAQRFSSDLSHQLEQMKVAVSESDQKISDKEVELYEAVSTGLNSQADQIEKDIDQIRREAHRFEIMIKSGAIQFSKMQPFMWCLELLKDRANSNQQRKEFAEIEATFNAKLIDFAKDFRLYFEEAKSRGLEVHIFGDKTTADLTNPFSKSTMRKKILLALDLVE